MCTECAGNHRRVKVVLKKLFSLIPLTPNPLRHLGQKNGRVLLDATFQAGADPPVLSKREVSSEAG